MRGFAKAHLWAGLIVASLFAAHAVAAPLPQRHPYQKVLRDYFATLTEADFTVELKPVAYIEDYFKDVDTVGRHWMFFLTGQYEIPPNQGIRLPPKYFTLASIEAGNAVNVGGGFMSAKDVAWWTQWDYPGNPYYKSKPAKLRAFVMAAADMMMQDEEHEAGKNLRSDFLGGSMLRYAYTYRAARDAAPEPVQKAYADGLVRMFEKLEKATPQGSGGSDMEFFQLSSMWYAADALGGDFKKRALDRAHVVIDTITSKTGYEKHGSAFDVSYQGIALRFLTWGAMLYKDPKINEALHKMLVLKSHLSLPEPGGKLMGPTHFNTGTAGDAPNDQWAWPSRDLAMAMLDDAAFYTVWSRVEMLNEADLRAAVKAGFGSLANAAPFDEKPAPWAEAHWNDTLNFAFENYQPGFYKKLTEMAKANSPLTKPLYSRAENFIRDLNGGGEFLAAKFNDFAVVVHTGAIAKQWANGVSGKSGGEVSAFWTPEGGTAILGRCRATQSDTFDEWTDAHKRGPYTWAVHAITGKAASGNYFSTARIRDIASKYAISGNDSAVVTITGDLAGSPDADPQDDLKGAITYAREFKIDKSGVAVTSGLTLDGKDKIQELWETLPIHIGPDAAKAEIAFHTGGAWQPATEAVVEADQIRVTRYGKAVLITLAKPRKVKAPVAAEAGAYGGATIRNVMIDLLPIKGDRASVEYKITKVP
ncbi:MAG: hypothetical protein NTW19_13145 [Planctomycetota bacterium]|nr:hypothetical protein [Planctomycetota bacterium]